MARFALLMAGGGVGYSDARNFVAAMRDLGVTPYVAQHTNGR